MLMYFMNQIKSLISNERGQGMVEYALIISGIAIVVFVVFGALSGQLTTTFNTIITKLGGTPTP